MVFSCFLKAIFSGERVYWEQKAGKGRFDMEITLELVERLREKADVSYEEAKAALEEAGGSLLDALILLERRGRIPAGAPRGAVYSTRSGGAQGEPEGEAPQDVPPAGGDRGRFYGLALTVGGRKEKAGPSGRAEGEKTEGGPWAFLQNLLRASLENRLEVWQGESLMTGVPLLILALLLVLAFWITLPLLLVGLMLGCRYRLSGPDFDKDRNEPRKK